MNRWIDMNRVPEKIKGEYPFRGYYFRLMSGHRMHYLDEGVGGVPVLMVHGNPTWSFMYRGLIKGMKGERRCIAVDHIGCGLSDKPQDYEYTLKEHVGNLRQLVDFLGLKKFDLVVHDWGGAIGFGMAREISERVRRIVILNTAAFRYPKVVGRISFLRNSGFLGEVLIRGLNVFALGAVRMAAKKRLSDAVKGGYLLPYDSWENRVGVNAFVKGIPLRPGDRNYEELREIEMALGKFSGHEKMLFWGKRDFCFHEGIRKEWMKIFPGMESRLYDAGHYLMEGEPGVQRDIIDFLSKE